MTTEEGNKLIAEFMDWYHSDKRAKELRRLVIPEQFIIIESIDYDKYGDAFGIITTTLKFHSSWDWLVPVVKKTKEILLTEKNWRGLPPDFYMQFCDINDVWGAVVNFIEWYNKQHSAA